MNSWIMNNYYRSAKSAVKVAKHLAPLTVDFAHYLKSCFIDYYFLFIMSRSDRIIIIITEVQSLQ